MVCMVICVCRPVSFSNFNIDASEKIIDNLKTIKLFLQLYMYLFNGLTVSFWVDVVSKFIFWPNIMNSPGFPPPLDNWRLISRIA